jgi:hypothetical protein
MLRWRVWAHPEKSWNVFNSFKTLIDDLTENNLSLAIRRDDTRVILDANHRHVHSRYAMQYGK